MSKRSANLDVAVFAPVALVLLVTGAGSFILLDRVNDFVERSIRENLLSMSDGLYGVADLAFDELDRRGATRDRVETELSKLSVFMRFEDFARQNDIGLILRSGASPAAVHLINVSSGIARTLKGVPASPDGRAISVDGRTIHVRTREFSPWGWQMMLVRDAAAFAVLEARARNSYLVTGAVLLLVASLLAAYLRRAFARPVGRIVARLRAGEAPDYKGIREFEFVSDEIAELMASLSRHQDELERLVEVRTAELAQAKRRLDDAIESSPGGFSMYDAEDRLAVFNSKYVRLYTGMEEVITVGSPFETIIREALGRGILGETGDDGEAWIEARKARRRDPGEPMTRRRGDDRWLQIDDRRTAEGGTVSWYTDVTELKALNVLKDRYVGMAAHDLRNPLAYLYSMGQMFRDGDLAREKGRDFVEAVPKVARQMLNLIQDLLEDSTTDPERPDLHATDLRAVIEERVRIASDRARRWGITIETDLALVDESMLDAARIRRLADNLLSNALKFSEPGTTVRVGCRQVGDWLEVEVRDEGQGMSPEDVSKLFEPFEKLAPRPLHGETSTRLGMSIVKGIVDGHGGEIDVASAVGAGTAFTIRLPSRRPG